MESFLQDLKYAIRQLVKSPGFTAAVIVTLGLGIGANTAMFSLVDGLLIRRLPYADPDRLVRIWETPPDRPDDLRSVAHPTLSDWVGAVRSFDGLALYGPTSLDIGGEDRPEQLAGFTVSPGFFATIGTLPALGRTFRPEEELPGGPDVIILSDQLWRRRYHADPGIVGRSLRLGGKPYTVVGVMPRDSIFPIRTEFWISTAQDHEYAARYARHLSAIGRLKPGVSLAAAAGELTQIEGRLAMQFPQNYQGYGVKLMLLQEREVGTVRPTLRLLFAAVGAVLLIACANVANLLLVRATSRQREIALRSALGAGRKRIAAQLVTEGVVLAVGGAVLGVGIAVWVVDAARASVLDIPRMARVAVDGRVLGFSALIALSTGVLVGVLPAVQLLSTNLFSSLREGGRGHTVGTRSRRVRSGLIVGQIALALVLLSAASAFIRSAARLAAVDPGLQTDGVLAFHVGLAEARQGEPAHVVSFYRQLREKLLTVPGVVDAALASRLPLSGEDHSNSVRLLGEAVQPGAGRSAQDRAVSPDYFRTLGITVRGREFAEQDGPGAPPVAMINEAFARQFFPDQDALGSWIVPSRAGGVARQIVGVAGNTHQGGLETPPQAEFYLSHAQDPWPWLSVVVRTVGEPRSLLPQMERAVWSLDPDMPLTEVTTLDEMRSATMASQRLTMSLLGAFAGLALVLAALGVYGVMTRVVADRTQETGIRLALGARPGDVLRMIVGDGMGLAGLGVLIGVAGWLAVARGLQAMLFGVSGSDYGALVAGIVVLVASALLATYLPARAAARLDPVSVMRGE